MPIFAPDKERCGSAAKRESISSPSARITPNTNVPPVVITGMTINNQPLSHDKMIASPPPLFYHDRVVSFEFAALNFIQPGRNRYKYRMEGFDRVWVAATPAARMQPTPTSMPAATPSA
jgi:hypothetical protein